MSKKKYEKLTIKIISKLNNTSTTPEREPSDAFWDEFEKWEHAGDEDWKKYLCIIEGQE